MPKQDKPFYIQITRDADGLELLPELVETELFALYDPEKGCRAPKSIRQLVGLYEAIRKRENYFQIYSPSSIGNKGYEWAVGEVTGFLRALELIESDCDGKIIIRSRKKKLMIIEKPKRRASYSEEQKAVVDAWRDLGMDIGRIIF